MAENNILEELFIKIGMVGQKGAKKSLNLLRKGFKALIGDSKVFRANLAAIGVTGAFNKLSAGIRSARMEFQEFVTESITLAGVQEEAGQKLEASMKTAGDFTQEAYDDLVQFAGAMQDISKIGDEVIIEQQAIIKAYGATNEQVKQLTEASLELSAATGKSLEESVRQTAKTLGGYAGELGELNPEIKALTMEQLKAGKAAEILLKQYGGTSAKQLNNFNAQSTQLANIWGDMKELAGEPIIQTLMQPIRDLKVDLKEMAPSFKEFGEDLAGAFRIMKRIFDSFGGNNLIGTALKKFGNFTVNMALLIEDLMKYMRGEPSALGSRIGAKGGFSQIFTDLAQDAGVGAAKFLWEFGKGVTVGIAGIIKEGVKEAFSFDSMIMGVGGGLSNLFGGDSHREKIAQLKRQMEQQQDPGFLGGGLKVFAGGGAGGNTNTSNNSTSNDNKSVSIVQHNTINTRQTGNEVMREIEESFKQFAVGEVR